MATKQRMGLYSPDNSKYGTITDGVGQLLTSSTSATGTDKQLPGSQAPDGSIYFCLTDGNNTLN